MCLDQLKVSVKLDSHVMSTAQSQAKSKAFQTTHAPLSLELSVDWESGSISPAHGNFLLKVGGGGLSPAPFLSAFVRCLVEGNCSENVQGLYCPIKENMQGLYCPIKENMQGLYCPIKENMQGLYCTIKKKYAGFVLSY